MHIFSLESHIVLDICWAPCTKRELLGTEIEFMVPLASKRLAKLRRDFLLLYAISKGNKIESLTCLISEKLGVRTRELINSIILTLSTAATHHKVELVFALCSPTLVVHEAIKLVFGLFGRHILKLME